MKFNLLFFLQFVIIVSSKVKIEFPQVYEDVDETDAQMIPNISKSDQRFSITNQPQIDLQKLRYVQQQNIDTQNRIKAKNLLRVGKNPKVPKKREIRLHNFNEVPLYLLHQTYQVPDENKFEKNYYGGKDEIRALHALIGKNPDAQIEGLKLLLQNNHKPITEHIVDVSNPQRQPNVKVEPSLTNPQPNYQTFAPRTDEHNYLALIEIEKSLNDEVKLKAQEALVRAQEQALKVVEAQHHVLAVAKAQAEKEALEKVHRYETVSTFEPVLVEQSVVDKNKDGDVSIENLDKISFKSRLKREIGSSYKLSRNSNRGRVDNELEVETSRGSFNGKEGNKRSKRDNPALDYYDDTYEFVDDGEKQSEYSDSNFNPIVNVNDRVDNRKHFLSSQILTKLTRGASLEDDDAYLSDRIIVPKRSNEYVNAILPQHAQNAPEYPSRSPDVDGLISSLIGKINPSKTGLVIIKPKPKIKNVPYLTVNNQNNHENVHNFEEPKLPVDNLEDILKIIGQRRPNEEAYDDYSHPQLEYENIRDASSHLSSTSENEQLDYRGSFENSRDLISPINQNSEPSPQAENVEGIFSLIDQIQHPDDYYTTARSVLTNPSPKKIKSIQDILSAFDQKPEQTFPSFPHPPVRQRETTKTPISAQEFDHVLLSLGLNRPRKVAPIVLSNPEPITEDPHSITQHEDFIVDDSLPNASQQSFNIIDNILSYVDQNSPKKESSGIKTPQVGLLHYVKPVLGSLATASQTGVDLFKSAIGHQEEIPDDLPHSNVHSKARVGEVESTSAPSENFNNIQDIINAYNLNRSNRLNLQNVTQPDHHSNVHSKNRLRNVEPTRVLQQNFKNIDNILDAYSLNRDSLNLQNVTKPDHDDLNDYDSSLIRQVEPTPVASVINNAFSSALVKKLKSSVVEEDEKRFAEPPKRPATVIKSTANSASDKNDMQRLRDIYNTIAFMNANEPNGKNPTSKNVYDDEVHSQIRGTRNASFEFEKRALNASRATVKNIEGSLSFLGQIKVAPGNEKARGKRPRPQSTVKLEIENSGDILTFLEPHASYEQTTAISEVLPPTPRTVKNYFDRNRNVHMATQAPPTFRTTKQAPLVQTTEMSLSADQIENILAAMESKQQAEVLDNPIFVTKEPDLEDDIPVVHRKQPDNRQTIDKLVKSAPKVVVNRPKPPVATDVEEPVEHNISVKDLISVVSEMKNNQKEESSFEDFVSMLKHRVNKNEVTTVAPDKSELVVEKMEQIISYLEQVKAQNAKAVNRVVLKSENQNKIDAKNMNEIITLLSHKNSPTVKESPKLSRELIDRVLELLSQTNLNLQSEEPKSKVEKIKEMLTLMDQNKSEEEEHHSRLSRLTLGEQLDLIMRNVNLTQANTINEPKLIIDDVRDYLSLVDQNEKMRNLLEVLPTHSNEPSENVNEQSVDELLSLINRKNNKDNLGDKSEPSDESQYYNYLKRIQRSPDHQNIFSHLGPNRANLRAHQMHDAVSQDGVGSHYPVGNQFRNYLSKIGGLSSASSANWREPPSRISQPKINRYEPPYVLDDYQDNPLVSPNIQNDFLSLAQQNRHHHRHQDPQTQNFADFLTLLKRVKQNSHPRTYNDMLTLLARGKQGLQDDYLNEEVKEDPSPTNQTIRDVMPLLEKNKPVNLIVINNSNDNHKNNQHKNYPRPRIPPPPPPPFYHSRTHNRNYEPRIPSWVLANRRRSDYVPDSSRPSYVPRY